jgi:indole-3-glycerol phosphate synthase
MSQNILNQIVANKRREVEQNKKLVTIAMMEQSVYFSNKVVSLKSYLGDPNRSGIIAEIKRKAPSSTHPYVKTPIEDLSIKYMQAGASALSVLTDRSYFGGSNQDLIKARDFNFCPILRKEFIIDEYQVVETKSIGADCILLIAACLEPENCVQLARLANSLGLEVLLEIRNETELSTHLNDYVDLVGVNNRNLDDFSIDLQTSLKLASLIPDQFLKISESGIRSAEDIQGLQDYGFQGFLIGSHFMHQQYPDEALKKLILELKSTQV